MEMNDVYGNLYVFLVLYYLKKKYNNVLSLIGVVILVRCK